MQSKRPAGNRKFDDEAGAGRLGVLDPDAPVVEPDVLGHERESQPEPVAAAPVAGLRRASEEPLEDALPVLGRDTGTAVLHLEPEAFAVDDGSLFLLQYLPAETPRAYRVTMLDLASGKVRPEFGPFKGPAERMPGIRLEQELAPDATQLFTLYSSARPGYVPHEPPSDDGRIVSFVHVLSLRDGWAHCVGLPETFWDRPASEQAMAVSPDGRSLYVVDAALGTIAVMDTESLRVRSGDVDLRVGDLARTSATVSADGGTLYVATSRDTSEVTAIDIATFDVLERWRVEGDVTGLGISSDGGHLLAATADGLEILDVTTGEEVDALEVHTPAPATKVLAIGS